VDFFLENPSTIVPAVFSQLMLKVRSDYDVLFFLFGYRPAHYPAYDNQNPLGVL